MSEVNQGSTSNRSYWIRSSFLTLLEKVFGLLFGLGLAILLWRNLSKAEMGSWAIFLLITSFVEMTRSGMIQNALMRFIAQYQGDQASIGNVQTSALVLSFLFSCLSTGLLFLGMDLLSSKFAAPELTGILPVYFIVNFAMIGMFHANYVQQSYLEFRGIFWSTFFYRGVPFAYALYCMLSKMPISLPILAYMMLLGAVIGAIVSCRYAWPFFHHARNVSREWIKRVLGFGKYVMGTNLATMTYKNIDKLAVSSFLGAEAMAVYDAAAKITQMVEVPSFSMAAVLFPQSARAAQDQGAEGVKYLYERSVGAILAFILPFVLICLVFAEPIVVLLAGEQYRESAGVLRMTALFGLFLPYAVQFGTILDSTGAPHLNFWYNAAIALLNMGLCYLFVRKFGLYGAACATLVTYVVSFMFMQRLLAKQYGTHPLNALKYVPKFYDALLQLLQKKIGLAA